MKTNFLNIALHNIPNPNVLVNVVSRRVRQLGQGHRPLVEADARMSYMEIALKEIAMAKIQFDLEKPPEIDAAARRRQKRR